MSYNCPKCSRTSKLPDFCCGQMMSNSKEDIDNSSLNSQNNSAEISSTK